MMCSDSSESRKNGCSEVHVVVAKESDVSERMIHTDGEQIQGNETRNFRDRGRESAKKGGGGWASWTAQALFAWTRAHDEPRKSGRCGHIAAGLLRADVSSGHRVPARFWTVGAKASHGNGRLPRCLLPCIRTLREEENFSTLSLRSAVEDGSIFVSFTAFCQ